MTLAQASVALACLAASAKRDGRVALANTAGQSDYLNVKGRSGLRVLMSSVAAAALVGLVATASVSAGGAHARGVKITSLPLHVVQGSLANLKVAVSRSAKCSLTVRYGNGRRQALGRFAAPIDRGLEWTWGVPTTATVGPAEARVACKGVGAQTGTFVVKRLRPSRVVVTKRGFTQLPDGRNGTAISWGLVLVNRSHKARTGVEVDVNFLDAAGNLLIQDGFRVAYIGPGVTYYLADQEYTAGFPALAQAATIVRGGHSTPSHAMAALAATNVQLSADGEGSAVVDGDVTNDETVQVPHAGICAVFFNSAGKVIGGACAPITPPALPPAAQTAFEIEPAPAAHRQAAWHKSKSPYSTKATSEPASGVIPEHLPRPALVSPQLFARRACLC